LIKDIEDEVITQRKEEELNWAVSYEQPSLEDSGSGDD
jgi:hypothetical protein